jgi:hypothetical protein
MITFLFVYFVSLESDGGEQGSFPNHYYVPLVSEFINNTLPEQEGSVGREDYVFSLGGLFSIILW